MSEIEFEDNSYKSRKILGDPTTPRMVNILIKLRIAKTPEQSYKILMIIGVLFIILSIVFFWQFYKSVNIPTDDPRYKMSEEMISTFPPDIQEKIRNNQK